MSEVFDFACKGITINWKIERGPDNEISSLFAFNWREDKRKKWELILCLCENENCFTLNKLSGTDSVKMNGILFILDDDGREWNLGHFEDSVFNNTVTNEFFDMKSLNEFPFQMDMFPDFVQVRIHLWDSLESVLNEPSMQYYVRSTWVEQSCHFNLLVESHVNDEGVLFVSNHSIQVPRSFKSLDNMKSFTLEIMSFIFEDFSCDEGENYFQIRKISKETLKQGCYVKCEVSAKNNEGKSIHLSELDWKIYSSPYQCFKMVTENLNYLKSKKDVYYPDGKLKLYCDLRVRCESIIIERIETVPSAVPPQFKNLVQNRINCNVSVHKMKESKSPSNLNASMFKLLEDGKLCDVVLRADKKTFHCHKNVLCSRSPVFLSMFENDTRENQRGAIDITDVDADTLSLFLSVLYKDVLDEADLDKVEKLYKVADKYLVPEIVKMCSDFLKEKLSCFSFCKVLALADAYQDEDLIDFANKYFFQNVAVVLKSKEWLEFMSVYPALTGKLMYSLSVKTFTK